jgi:hypothetical protein
MEHCTDPGTLDWQTICMRRRCFLLSELKLLRDQVIYVVGLKHNRAV